MSSPSTPVAAAPPPEELPAGEAQLGRALALIHRALPRLDELDRTAPMRCRTRFDKPRLSWRRPVRPTSVGARRIGPRWSMAKRLALIAAAVSVVLGRAHRVLDVQKASVSVAWVNAWAMEGRFQHYSSHKVR